MSTNKLIVLYGGESKEHEVSCRSVSYILNNIDKSKYNIDILAIDKDGTCFKQSLKEKTLEAKETNNLSITKTSKPKALVEYLHNYKLEYDVLPVIFPMIHGAYGEDGTLQGMLSYLKFPYVGSAYDGSAIAMNKIIAKKLVAFMNIAVVPWLEITNAEWNDNKKKLINNSQELGLPLFVKPACLGSSVGISKVTNIDALDAACVEAFKYDNKILIEKAISGREIEFAALGATDPFITGAGEVQSSSEFYSYAEKYNSNSKSIIIIPAKLDANLLAQGQEKSKAVYKALNLYGMARIDWFLEDNTNLLYFNEANTIPGFTSISQFPLLMENSGIKPNELINKLIHLAKANFK